MGDAGATSLANATYVVDKGLDYFLRLKCNQPTRYQEATRLLAGAAVLARTVDVPDNRTRVVESYAAWLDNMAILTQRLEPDGGILRTPVTTDLQLQQLGITGTVQGSVGGMSVKMFATVQRTDGRRMSRHFGEIEVQPGWLGRQRAMPTAFGGAIVSWDPVQDLHLTAAAHYTGEQRHEREFKPRATPPLPPSSVLRAKLLLHATVGYAFAPDWTVRLSYRNILDQQAREFPFCDRIRSTVVLGVEWDARL